MKKKKKKKNKIKQVAKKQVVKSEYRYTKREAGF